MKTTRACVHGVGLESSSHRLYSPGGWIKSNLTENQVIFNLGRFPSLSHWAAAQTVAAIQEQLWGRREVGGGKGEAGGNKAGTAAEWSRSSGSGP